MINTILVNQEINCLNNLSSLIEEYCPELNIVAQCQAAKSAIDIIAKHKPSLVFLDLEMYEKECLQLLPQIKTIPFGIILTSQPHISAQNTTLISALAFLKEPINPLELVASVKKYIEIRFNLFADDLMLMIGNLKKPENTFKKIAFPTSDGFELVPVDKILKCEANNNYTHIYLADKTIVIACRTLKEIEEQLLKYTYFFRIHHSYIINLNEVTKYVRGKGGYVVLSNGSTVNVSRSRKEALINFFINNQLLDLH